jgi:hypothetical protein
MGCVHFNTVSSGIAPTAATPQKSTVRVAVYFTPRLVNCEVVREPDTMHGRPHKYYYRWGPAVQEALTKSVRSAYANISVVTVLPRPGEFDRVLAFDLPKVGLTVEFIPGYLRQEARAKAAVYITMEILDGKSMRTLKTLPVKGAGASAEDASGFTPYTAKHFTEAMEKAIQQLSEIVAQLLITGAAEPPPPAGRVSCPLNLPAPG